MRKDTVLHTTFVTEDTVLIITQTLYDGEVTNIETRPLHGI